MVYTKMSIQNCLVNVNSLLRNIENSITQLNNGNGRALTLNRIPEITEITVNSNFSNTLTQVQNVIHNAITLLNELENTILLEYAYTAGKDKLKKLHKRIEDPEVIEAMLENKRNGVPGTIRVAKLSGARIKDGLPYVKIPGFININITFNNGTTIGSQLSTHKLRFKTGEIMENLLQFSRFYDIVPEIHSENWSWGLEQHCDSNNRPTKAYWDWRRTGFMNPVPVMPVKNKKPICYLWKDASGTYKQHDTVGARKNIYIPLYKKLAHLESDFLILKQCVKAGYNVQLLEYSGPPNTNGAISESEYNRITKMYEDFGETTQGTVVINEKNFKHIINSDQIQFSHGYVLGALLAQII
jgi:hypothetical protein